SWKPPIPNMGPAPSACSMRAIASPPVISLLSLMAFMADPVFSRGGFARHFRSLPAHARGGRDYSVDADARLVLQDRRIADGNARCAETLHRRVEPAVEAVGDRRRDLRSEARDLDGFVDDEKTPGPLHACQYGFLVPRP